MKRRRERERERGKVKNQKSNQTSILFTFFFFLFLWSLSHLVPYTPTSNKQTITLLFYLSLIHCSSSVIFSHILHTKENITIHHFIPILSFFFSLSISISLPLSLSPFLQNPKYKSEEQQQPTNLLSFLFKTHFFISSANLYILRKILNKTKGNKDTRRRILGVWRGFFFFIFF